MLRFPKRRTPWLTAGCLFFNTLVPSEIVFHLPAQEFTEIA